jgi:hypothetical protein
MLSTTLGKFLVNIIEEKLMSPKSMTSVIISDTLMHEFLTECVLHKHDIQTNSMREGEFLILLQNSPVLGVFTSNTVLLTKLRSIVPNIKVMYKHEVSLTLDTDLVLVDYNNPFSPYVCYSASPTLEGYAENQAKKVWRDWVMA